MNFRGRSDSLTSQETSKAGPNNSPLESAVFPVAGRKIQVFSCDRSTTGRMISKQPTSPGEMSLARGVTLKPFGVAEESPPQSRRVTRLPFGQLLLPVLR